MQINFIKFLVEFIIIFIILLIIKGVSFIIKHIGDRRAVKLVDEDTNQEKLFIIKNCPFCGKNVVRMFNAVSEQDGEMYLMVCDVEHGGCGATTAMCETPEIAINMWNLRKKKLFILDDESIYED